MGFFNGNLFTGHVFILLQVGENVSFEMMWDKDGGLLATMDLSENCISSHISAVHCGNCCWSISVSGRGPKSQRVTSFKGLAAF